MPTGFKNPLDFTNKYSIALRALDCKIIAEVALKRCLSVNHIYVLSAKLDELTKLQTRRFSFKIERASDDDFHKILEDIRSVDSASRRELIIRMEFRKAGFANCYVMRTEKEKIVAMQWVVYPCDNSLLLEKYPRRYYPLKKMEVMLENVFVYPRYRGLGIVPMISWETLALAQREGYTRAVGYIYKDKIDSLNEFMRMGFKIRKLIREVKIVGYTKRMLRGWRSAVRRR